MKGWALIFCAFSISFAAVTYHIGNQGDDCYKTCFNQNKNCNPHIATNNSIAIFNRLGIQCTPDEDPWWAEDQPGYVSDPKDPNYKKCVGYVNVPAGVMCGGRFTATRRLCACDDATDASMVGAFGTGLSNAVDTTTEQSIFSWVLQPGSKPGVMTHFWATASRGVLETTRVRYYIDGETTPSIDFIVPLACGTGFGDEHAPWANKWIGKGAADGSWWHNLRIPFQKSIYITAQNEGAVAGSFYIIVRGAPGIPIDVGGLPVPSNARMNLNKIQQLVPRLAWVPVVDVPSGNGVMFFHTFAVSSSNLNFLEGCYHAYTPYNQAFPGTVISTGTEDYFDSGWYFNAGAFQAPVAGLTHFFTNSTTTEVSAYRFHEMDPLPFSNGFKFMWRNGDTYDAAGRKCYTLDEARPAGNPQESYVITYTWYYTW